MRKRSDKQLIDQGIASVKRNAKPVMRKVGATGTHILAAGILSSHPVGAFAEGTLYGAKLNNKLQRMGREQERNYASERAALSEASFRKRQKVRAIRAKKGQ